MDMEAKVLILKKIVVFDCRERHRHGS